MPFHRNAILFSPAPHIPASENPQPILRVMSPQRLYDLDMSSTQFSDQLDELLHDKEYVYGLRTLSEIELVQLVDHMYDVRFSSVISTHLIVVTDPDSS